MSFYPQFVNFCRSAQWASPELCGLVANYLADSPTTLTAKTIDFATKCTLPVARRLVNELQQAAVIVPADYSSEAEGDPDDAPFRIADDNSGVVTQLDAARLRVQRLAAAGLANSWRNRGTIAYLTFDIISSEEGQLQNPLAYPELVRTVFDTYWPIAVERCAGKTLRLGEVGDLIKIAFWSASDAFDAIERFVRATSDSASLLDKVPWFRDDAGTRPRFAATLSLLSLRVGAGPEAAPDRLLKCSLDGQWDIHHPAVTTAFRLGTSPKAAARAKPFCVALEVTTAVFDDLRKAGAMVANFGEEFPQEKKKHNYTQTESFRAIALYPDGHREPLGKADYEDAN